MDRRTFLIAGQSSLLALAVSRPGWATIGAAATRINLVPEHAGSAPNYWCTWGVQMSLTDLKRPDARKMSGEDYTRQHKGMR